MYDETYGVIYIWGNLYATTGEGASHLHKFTRNGIHIKSGGKHGTAEGQFSYSNGPRVSKNNELHVCDSLASRVQQDDYQAEHSLDENMDLMHVGNM